MHCEFELWAAEYPDRIAVTEESGSVSYGELNRMANRLAHRLSRAGAGPGRLVGVLAERGSGLITALLAVLKTASGYVPLDPVHPPQRIRWLIEECGTGLVVGSNRYRDTVREDRTEFVPLDDRDLLAEDEHDPNTVPGPGSSMYVIHTSGSTGKPKGVDVPHSNPVRLFAHTRDKMGITSSDVWTAFHSHAFDFSVWEMWGALAHGGRLVIVPHELTRDPELFWAQLLRERVTVLNQTPTAFARLIDAALREGFPQNALRLVVFGGEELTPELLGPWFEAYGDERPRLVNMYGITEATVHVTFRPLDVHDVEASESPLGTPLDDLVLRLLDQELRPVQCGETGELYVGGEGIARGYLGRPALTAERFLPDPYGSPGSRLYRTGDLARRRPDGDLVFRGRADRQVQLRGFRVEPGEIETALRELLEVSRAAVVAREDPRGDLALIGYVVPAEGVGIEPREVRSRLSRRLPSYMLPTAVLTVDSLPMTVQHKLDVDALPLPWSGAGKPPSSGGLGDHDASTRALAEVMAEVLDLSAVDPDDDFFALGGDSIRAARLVGLARQRGVELGVTDVYTRPTARRLTTSDPLPAPGDGSLAEESTKTPALSSGQQGILYECELIDDPTLYRVLVAVQLSGRMDVAALKRALADMVERHEVLNGFFELDEQGTFRWCASPCPRIPVSVSFGVGRGEDFRARLVREWERKWSGHVTRDRAPPLHCHVLPRFDGDWYLALVVHHALLDGWSTAVLGTELLHSYRVHIGETEEQLPEVFSPSPWEHVERERRAGKDERTRHFWEQRLPRLDPGPPPPGGGDVGTAGSPAEAAMELDSATDGTVRSIAARLSVPPKTVYLAAGLWVTAALTGHPSPVIGTATHMRPESRDGDRLLGMFLNVLPVGVSLAESTRWEELICEVFEQEVSLLPHRWMPLADLVSRKGSDLFHVVLNYTDFRVLGGSDGVDPRERGWTFVNRTNFPLFIEVQHGPIDDSTVVTARSGMTSSVSLSTVRKAQRLMREALFSIFSDPEGEIPEVPSSGEH
nr:non-ribosomal peptide synthetase [Actinopolyspora biskrensis]